MNEARAALPAPGPQGLEGQLAAYRADLAETRRVIAALDRKIGEMRARPDTGRWSTEWVMALNRLADLGGDMRAADEHIRAAAVLRTLSQMRAADQAAAVPPPETVPVPPRGRHRPGLPRQRSPGERALSSVKGFAPVAAFLAAPHLRILAGAHRVLAAAAVTGAAGAAITGAAVVTSAPPAHASHGGHAAFPAPAASVYGAAPIALPSPSPSPAAGAAHASPVATGRAGLSAAGASQPPSALPWFPPPSSPQFPASPPSADPPSSASAQAGPAVLSLGGITSLDLSAVPQATITLTASGAGWVPWSAGTTGTDLDFSPARGVLQAGETVTVTVSLDAAQDGLVRQSFEIGGQEVAVTLPLPVPVPSVPPSILPTALPSLLPGL